MAARGPLLTLRSCCCAIPGPKRHHCLHPQPLQRPASRQTPAARAPCCEPPTPSGAPVLPAARSSAAPRQRPPLPAHAVGWAAVASDRKVWQSSHCPQVPAAFRRTVFEPRCSGRSMAQAASRSLHPGKGRGLPGPRAGKVLDPRAHMRTCQRLLEVGKRVQHHLAQCVAHRTRLHPAARQSKASNFPYDRQYISACAPPHGAAASELGSCEASGGSWRAVGHPPYK